MSNILQLADIKPLPVTYIVPTNADWIHDLTLQGANSDAVIDITNIQFVANLRLYPGGTEVFMVATTDDGSIVNGGATGIVSLRVPRAKLEHLIRQGPYALDILAVANGHYINLYSEGAAEVTVSAGVTHVP